MKFLGILLMLFYSLALHTEVLAKEASGFMPEIYLGANPGDPPSCNCLNNATTLDNGQFSEVVTIAAPSGQNWTVQSNTGFYAAGSPAPPAAPTLISDGTAIPESVTDPGIYQLSGLHIDGQSFSLTVSNGSETLSISNTCYYPNISIINFPDEICMSSLPVTLEGNAGGVAGNGSFFIDGNAATVFDPQLLGAGDHTITYTFDAGTGTPGNSADPACIQSVSQQVTIKAVPNIVVNNQVNASLGSDCMITLIPDHVMEGDYPCMDDYIVTVFAPDGTPLGNKISSDFMGQILRVEISTLAGGFTGQGNVLFIDSAAPVIDDCAEDTDIGTIIKNVQTRGGSLAIADPTFFPTNFACLANQIDIIGQSHYYDLYTFTVNQTDTYVFELDTDFGFGAGLLYAGGFSMLSGPCSNYIAVPKRLDSGEGFFTSENQSIRLAAQLQAGKEYTLLTTSANGTQLGNYTWAFYAVNHGRINGLSQSSAPVVLDLFCTDYQQILNNPQSILFTGQPTVDDACPEDPTVTFTDDFLGFSECEESIIRRTFTVTDGANNSVQCVQEIKIQQLDISDIVPPQKNVFLDCADNFATTQTGNPHPDVSGRPFVLSAFGAWELDQKYCNLIATYRDQPLIRLCDGSSQFFRRWFFYDDCETSNTQTYDQIIRVMDQTGPEVICSAPDLDNDNQPDTLFYNTSSGSCTASFEVPLAQVSDDCSTWMLLTEIVKTTEIVVMTNTGPQNQLQTEIIATVPHNAVNREVSGIPIGCYTIRYTAIDDCGNTTVVECPICVIDTVQPVAVCDDNLIVSLGGGGVGSVYAVDVNEGSRDNCGIERMDIRRQIDFDTDDCSPVLAYFTAWGEYVDFYCCEVGKTMMVQLQITDSAGNQNNCMTEIQIEDKINPSCEAPDPVSILCADLPEIFDPSNTQQMDQLFGQVEVEDNCAGASIQELSPIIDLDNCGVGTITRRFGGTDAQNNETGICQQVITLRQSLEYAIKFPKDVFSECGVPVPDTIEITGGGCNSIAVTVDDKIFATSAQACFAIHRTYLVINACESDGVGDPVVIERNQDCIDGGGEEDVWLVVNENGAFIDEDNDPENSLPAAGTKSAACDGNTNPEGYWRSINSMGYWMYTQIIYIVDNTAPIMAVEPMDPFCVANQQSCTANVVVDFTVDEDCSANEMNIEVIYDQDNDGIQNGNLTNTALSGSFPNYQITGNFPIGTHAFIVQLNDGCNNENTTKVTFEVRDCEVTAPNCLNGLFVDLAALPPGSDADGDGDADAAAWVVAAESMLIGSNVSDCSGQVDYSVFRMDDINGGLIPDRNNPSLTFTCDDLGSVEVRVYAWDGANNPDAQQPDGSLGGNNNSFCETTIQVLDDDFDCNNGGVAMGKISGMIMTESEQPIIGVSLRPADYMPPMMQTKHDGHYVLDELEPGLDYQVMAELPDDYLNGVSTLDIILTAKHILGIQPLTSAYQIIAADVNESGSVTTQDLILLRKLILHIEDELPGGRSWRFVAANYDFPQIDKPWKEAFPETISIQDLHGHMENQNFIGIKIGDVDGSAIPSGQARTDQDTATCFLYANEQKLVAGEWYSIDFKNTATDQIAGFQFTLEFDPEILEISGLRHGLIREDHTSLKYLERGKIIFSWDATESDWVLPEEVGAEVLFGLRVRARKNGNISDLLHINSSLLHAEAYTNKHDLMNLQLQFVGELPQDALHKLLQNRPNPFYDRTTIDFYLPQDGLTHFTVFDANGKMVWQRKLSLPAGYNQLELKGNELPAQGVYYYRLESGNFSETKKMIFIQ